VSILMRNSAVTGVVVTAIISVGLIRAAPASGAQVHAQAASAASKHARKGMPSVAGIAPRARVAADTYLYGGVYQFTQADGASVSMTVGQPELEPGVARAPHSLGEVAAESADGQQIVEVGWTIDRTLNPDARPHLFVFHWVNGSPGCYNGCGYQQVDNLVAPGAAMGANTQHHFEILYFEGNWWIQLDNEWIGFFPGSLWSGGFTRTGLVQFFGEVYAESASPCTDMGNGEFADNTAAASISSVTYPNGPATNLSVNQTDPTLYTAALNGTTGGRFGGPGAGVC
jgi:hypothetical protein